MQGGSSRNRAPNWGGMTILIVDQDNEFRFWARSVFRKKGVMEVYSTASGADALEILRNNDVDIGLVDLVMEDMDGVRFIQEMRDSANNKQAAMPVVLLTRSADLQALAPAFDAGVENMIQKPVSEAVLLQRTGSTATNPQRVVLKGAATRKNRRTKEASDEGGPKQRARPDDQSDTSEEALVSPNDAARSKGGKTGKRARPVGRRSKDGGTLDDVETPARDRGQSVSDDDWNAELEKPSSKNASLSSDEDWKATFDDQEKEVRIGEDVDEIDVDAIVAQHGVWLETRAAQGQRANLEKLDIAGIDLAGKDMSNANMRSTDLSDAVCVGTIFQGADLRSASLSGATRISASAISRLPF